MTKIRARHLAHRIQQRRERRKQHFSSIPIRLFDAIIDGVQEMIRRETTEFYLEHVGLRLI